MPIIAFPTQRHHHSIHAIAANGSSHRCHEVESRLLASMNGRVLVWHIVPKPGTQCDQPKTKCIFKFQNDFQIDLLSIGSSTLFILTAVGIVIGTSEKLNILECDTLTVTLCVFLVNRRCVGPNKAAKCICDAIHMVCVPLIVFAV